MKFIGWLFDCIWRQLIVVVNIGVPVGNPWVTGEQGHVNKKMAEKMAKKQTIDGTTFFFNNKSNQSTISQIFSQSDKMDANVNDI